MAVFLFPLKGRSLDLVLKENGLEERKKEG
jgi:hypothetical protein